MAWFDWGVLMVAATAAGWVDAVVGGGGLILLPAILITMPQLSPQMALATNKLTSINGTAAAVFTFSRKVAMQWRLMIPAAVLAAVFAGLGAAAVSLIDKALFIPIVMVLLVAIAVFVTMRPTLGTTLVHHQPSPVRVWTTVLLAGGVIGFYDGLLGPGTGTFLIVTFAVMLGTEFVRSAAMAKVINLGSNLGALIFFAATGNVWWTLGLAMAACNVLGAVLGARMALAKGAGFIRIVLLVVVVVMVIRLGWQQFAQ
jgi:uncharacterized membrane protein YfcA